MIDVHSHILPGVDDGAKTLEESLAMLRLAAGSGTTDIVASPHANHEYKFDPDVNSLLLADLRHAIGGTIRIHHGCDFHLSYDNIQDALKNPRKYAINNKNYVLVEFSDLLIPKTTDDVFYQMRMAGMIPIITHPERNMLLQQRLNQLKAWAESGCLLQVTGGSLLGRFGKQAKAFADRLMKEGLAHIVASDAHDTRHRPPSLKEAFEYVARTYGPERAEMLFHANPAAVLTGDPVDPYPEVVLPQKKWFQFWT
ncbi:MAG TPA: CpsB/CapC family capsule biosynthesis tyrosine phosphatase [Bryobacteraceae bacterium]|nr:CpsB/CapC family capsule biosynthesis tyrosine phosphatase [Bryobacteraceae bacterium]